MERIDQFFSHHKDPAYQAFQKRLLPDTENILGIRLPLLRQLAKTIYQEEDWYTFLNTKTENTFEHHMLKGMIIGCIKDDVLPLETIFDYIRNFLPEIDNWSVCDSFCASLQLCKKHPDAFWNFLIPMLSSASPFTVRFALVMLTDYFISADYLADIFKQIDVLDCSDYYVSMAAAWCLSICCLRFPEDTLAYLKHSSLDSATFKRTCQKIRDSRRADAALKARVNKLRQDK